MEETDRKAKPEKMTKHFYLIASQREHVLRHFNATGMAGSHFYDTVFKTPEELTTYINSSEPHHIIYQANQRSAYCFAFLNGRAIGTYGLAKRRDLPDHQIEKYIREGYTIDIGLLDQLPETNEFCVIADTTTDGLSIITAFPGSYARPFAQRGQPDEEFALNKQFWEEHVLLKQK